MRIYSSSPSRSRGGTCLEYAIILGVIGALLVFAGMGVSELELARASRSGGEICR